MQSTFLEKAIPLIRGLSFDGEKGRLIKYENNPEKVSKISQYINELSKGNKIMHSPFFLDIYSDEEWSREKEDNYVSKITEDYKGYLNQYCHAPRIIVLGKEIILFSGSTYQECLDIQNDPFSVLLHRPTDEKPSHKSEFDVSRYVEGKVIVVTGGAQGIGACLVRTLAKMNVFLLIADINQEGAEQLVQELNHHYGKKCALSISVDVTEEKSVQKMADEIVKNVGGIDVFISNAGVLKAGSVKEMDFQDFQIVNKVNYFGYFLCTKHVSKIMSWQNKANPEYTTDIIQINSKTGLEGSNKNCAYAGSKFAGIGLTQSFAKELIKDNIKVNSICPGNFFEGPLWSNPQNGLFVQYLQSGKVPGAKNIDDVRRFYESKVPMGRGCQCEDIAKGVLYVIGQKYETGQAIPITGGQVMLR
jgi:sorbitol-6-phosphate 2-dehydrogenase